MAFLHEGYTDFDYFRIKRSYQEVTSSLPGFLQLFLRHIHIDWLGIVLVSGACSPCIAQYRQSYSGSGASVELFIMDKRHRELLRSNRRKLMADLDAWSVSNYLFEKNILSVSDFQLIRAGKTELIQAEKVLNIVPQRGPDAFDTFCQALRETDGQRHLLDLLITPGSAPQGVVSSTRTELSSNPPADSVDGMSNVASRRVRAALKNNNKFPKTREDM
ncbi:caspase-2-like [Acropora millepora]|uniref:caspase-2-like n=1 Tax=Acropora millepora TaxID=45264 RepID=UPI001CF5FE68|nr:caspase-2-like [Acropora millepora]